MDSVLTLYTVTRTQNSKGAWVNTRVPRDVFCQVNSVTRSEFYAAGRSGLNPEFQFTVFQGDYNGEAVCRYAGNDYAIYRTYIVPGTDYIELYAERKGGTNR